MTKAGKTERDLQDLRVEFEELKAFVEAKLGTVTTETTTTDTTTEAVAETTTTKATKKSKKAKTTETTESTDEVALETKDEEIVSTSSSEE